MVGALARRHIRFAGCILFYSDQNVFVIHYLDFSMQYVLHVSYTLCIKALDMAGISCIIIKSFRQEIFMWKIYFWVIITNEPHMIKGYIT